MGDYKNNPTATMRTMLPAMLPPGYAVAVDYQLQVLPSLDVIIMQPEHIAREGEQTKVQGRDGQWRTIDPHTRVHEAGKPLPAEFCDIVLVAVAVVQDTVSAKVLDRAGRPAAGSIVGGPLGVLAREPLAAWQEAVLDGFKRNAS